MNLLEFYTKGAKATEGVWIDVGDGTRLKIARMDNPNYTAFIQTQKAKIGRRPSDELAQEVIIDAAAHTLLLDWEGLKLGDEEVPYSTDYAAKLMRELKGFHEMILGYAYDGQNFREDEIDGIVAELRPT